MAEISAFADICGVVDGAALKTENPLIKERFLQTAREEFGSDPAKMLSACWPVMPKSECCKRAYIRGAYLCAGTMADPKKAYHMEVTVSPRYIDKIREIFAFFGLSPKIHRRKSSHILYFKEAEQIATILNIMGAHLALMEFENCRAHKDVNNDINRISNAAGANEDKMIRASAAHVADIMDIQKTVGLGFLNKNLADIAHIRLENPLISLENIGKKLEPPISKSGVNHRLKKIAQIADKLRNGGHYDTERS